jgi:CRP-like cAMP-binding protein
VSKTGKEATLGMLSQGEFFGEGCLVGRPVRMKSATTMTDCKLLCIDKKAMIEALHREHEFSDMFVANLMTRNIRYEEDLVDHLFNSSEKRLARALLKLARFGREGTPQVCNPEDQPGNPRRDDRHYPLAGQLFHEPLQRVRLRRLWRGRVASS